MLFSVNLSYSACDEFMSVRNCFSRPMLALRSAAIPSDPLSADSLDEPRCGISVPCVSRVGIVSEPPRAGIVDSPPTVRRAIVVGCSAPSPGCAITVGSGARCAMFSTFIVLR